MLCLKLEEPAYASTVEQLVPVPLLFVPNQSCGSTDNEFETLGTVNLVMMHRTTNIYGMTEEAGPLLSNTVQTGQLARGRQTRQPQI